MAGLFGGFGEILYLCKCNRDYNCDCGMRLSILEQVQSAFALHHSCNQKGRKVLTWIMFHLII